MQSLLSHSRPRRIMHPSSRSEETLLLAVQSCHAGPPTDACNDMPRSQLLLAL